MKKFFTFHILLLGILTTQELPFGTPKYFEIEIETNILQIDVQVPSSFPLDIISSIEPYEFDNKDIYFIELQLNDNIPFHFKLINTPLPNGMTLYFINLITNGWVGPYSRNILQNQSSNVTGQMKSDRVLIEYSVPKGTEPIFPVQELILPKRPENFEETLNHRDPILRDFSNTILLCGYWPPSNECIRPFSRNTLTNPEGWVGENWENRGYDVISYFPEFAQPDCDNCGQGIGYFEVDYQDTSNDWWNIVDSLNPVAIITFSRGFIDYSWEMEWKYYNRFYWTADFTEPYFPTPTPPDSSVAAETQRNSSLPMDSIVTAINSANLGLNPYIDYSDGAGAYLSEFMGYHGVWYKAMMDSLNLPCYTDGHVHVGGLIDWEIAREAAKVTLREVIKIVDEYKNLPGDINEDGVVSILDMLFIVFHILGNIELRGDKFVIADLNADLTVDIYDLFLISNIIINY